MFRFTSPCKLLCYYLACVTLLDHVTLARVTLGNLNKGKPSSYMYLPNLLQSPHIRNQSLLNCGPRDPTLSIKVKPKKIEFGKRIYTEVKFTPHVNVVSATCRAAMYLDGIYMLSGYNTRVCNKDYIPCPMLKGETQTILFDSGSNGYDIRFVSKGTYTLKMYCENQDENQFYCLLWKFTWI